MEQHEYGSLTKWGKSILQGMKSDWQAKRYFILAIETIGIIAVIAFFLLGVIDTGLGVLEGLHPVVPASNTYNYDGNYVGSDNTATVTQEYNNYPTAYPKPIISTTLDSSNVGAGFTIYSIKLAIAPDDSSNYHLKSTNPSLRCIFIPDAQDSAALVLDVGTISGRQIFAYKAECSGSVTGDPSSLFTYVIKQ